MAPAAAPTLPPSWSHDALSHGSLDGDAHQTPPSPLAPLPAYGTWDDLDDLFARATDDSYRDSDDGEDRDKEGDPLCLSPPMLNAILCV